MHTSFVKTSPTNRRGGQTSYLLLANGQFGSRELAITWVECPPGSEQPVHAHDANEQAYVIVRRVRHDDGRRRGTRGSCRHARFRPAPHWTLDPKRWSRAARVHLGNSAALRTARAPAMCSGSSPPLRHPPVGESPSTSPPGRTSRLGPQWSRTTSRSSSCTRRQGRQPARWKRPSRPRARTLPSGIAPVSWRPAPSRRAVVSGPPDDTPFGRRLRGLAAE